MEQGAVLLTGRKRRYRVVMRAGERRRQRCRSVVNDEKWELTGVLMEKVWAIAPMAARREKAAVNFIVVVGRG